MHIKDPIKRQIAIELKTEAFKHSNKSQMGLYLAWLAKYEQEKDGNSPLGIAKCMTVLPSKEVLEHRLHLAVARARERFLVK